MNIPTSVKVTGTLIGAGLVGFLGYKIYKKVKDNKQINSFNKATISMNPDGTIVKNTKRKGIDTSAATSTINLNEIAEAIGIKLGTAYHSYDPRSWNEDEEGASIEVLKVPKPLIPQLSKIYQGKYGTNLQTDLQKLLDTRWNDVKQLFI